MKNTGTYPRTERTVASLLDDNAQGVSEFREVGGVHAHPPKEGSSKQAVDRSGSPAAHAAEGTVTLVAIDGELNPLRSRLQQALGPSYRVVAGEAVLGAAAAVVPARISRVEMLRTACPQAYIVVYGYARNEPASYLDAADDYVAASSMVELAARLRAGLRRLSWQEADR
jgi:hypothetical protein